VAAANKFSGGGVRSLLSGKIPRGLRVQSCGAALRPTGRGDACRADDRRRRARGGAGQARRPARGRGGEPAAARQRLFVPSGQNAAIKGNDSPGNLSVRGGFYNGAAIPLQGGANFASLSIQAPNVNNDSRAPFSDGQAGFGYFDSRFYRVAPDGTSYSSGPQSGGSGLNYFLDNDNGASTIWARSWNGGVQFDGYLQWARNAYVALNHTLGGTLRAADADVAVWDSAGLKVRLGALG